MLRTCALIFAALAASTLDWSGAAHARAGARRATARPHHRSALSAQGTPVVLIPGLASPPAVYDELAAKIGADPPADLRSGQRLRRQRRRPARSTISCPARSTSSRLARRQQDREAGGRRPFDGRADGADAGHEASRGRRQAHDRRCAALLWNVVRSLGDARCRPPHRRADARRHGQRDSPARRCPPHMSNTDAGKAKILAWLKASDPKVVGEALVEDATTDFRPELAGDHNSPSPCFMRCHRRKAKR